MTIAPARILFASLGSIEADFFGRVGAELTRLGHTVAHVTFSRRAAGKLRRHTPHVWCLPDELRASAPFDLDAEVERMAAAYAVPTFRDIHCVDFVAEALDERAAMDRTVRHLLAMERIFDAFAPTAVVPEVGNETIRAAMHLVGIRRDVPVLFLLNTIFDNPLRLSVDDLQRKIARPQDLRELSPEEQDEVRRFAAAFLARDTPIRSYRDLSVAGRRFRAVARHVAVKALWDRDNDYLRPLAWIGMDLKGRARTVLAKSLYEAPPATRPYLYFPLHVRDDYKLKRLIPHRMHQPSIVELVARALPHGYDLVVKEHPNSIGRNRFVDLLAMRRIPNVRIVEPRHSSNDLVRHSAGVVAISSTVGIEALLQHKRVMTLGSPYYAGAGVTMDLTTLAEVREALPAFLRWAPDPDEIDRFLHAAMRSCLPGSPVLIDRSEDSAVALAGSLAKVCEELAGRQEETRPLDPVRP